MVTPVDLTSSHAIEDNGADTTLCGLTAEEVPNLNIACGCGHELCEHPITCLTCLSIVNRKAN